MLLTKNAIQAIRRNVCWGPENNNVLEHCTEPSGSSEVNTCCFRLEGGPHMHTRTQTPHLRWPSMASSPFIPLDFKNTGWAKATRWITNVGAVEDHVRKRSHIKIQFVCVVVMWGRGIEG